MGSSIEETASSVAKRILEPDSRVSSFGSIAATASLAALKHQAEQRASLLNGLELNAVTKLQKQLSGLAKYSAGINLNRLKSMGLANSMIAEHSRLLSSLAPKVPDSLAKATQAIDYQRSGINAALEAINASNSGWAKHAAILQGTFASSFLTDAKRLLGEPLSSFTKQIEAMNALDPANSMRHVMEALRAPSLRMSERIAAISQSSPNYLSEVLAALNEPTRKFAEQMSTLQELHKRSAAEQYAFVNHRIELEGLDTFAAGEVGIRPASDEEIALNCFANSGVYTDGIKAIEALTKVLVEVSNNQAQKKSNPLWLQIFVNAIGGLVASIIFLIVQAPLAKAWSEFTNVAKPELNKKEVRALIQPQMRIDCINVRKLVRKNGLEVRATASANSKIISRLQCWDLVVVQEARKDWSLISWTDNSGSLKVQGWVFSRYLSKPNQL
ncbi:SH3 domain-containing protein [Chitinibacter fontanus]|uniref:SH3 domain-containing protein n=1 Tax=Chitinibacter fontanus TaxID=1737446 RepID=A0A7D5ZIN1_9NEIS|nr:SH3 domain-containing protein [Chitinibacter fontanus]QLI82948.1 SH3 domain-containing protein [Chitinibacter fontanus]